MPFLSHENTQIYYDEYGKGTPILFIHPPGMGRKVFYFQTNLSNQFRVIFPDLSGHGDTKGLFKNVSIKGYAKEVLALLDHLHIERAVLCGYSSGGTIAQEFALNYPERTSAVILAGGFPEVQSVAFKYEHIAGMHMVKNFPRLLAKLIAKSHTSIKKLNEDIYQHMLKVNHINWYQFYEESLHYSCVNRLNHWETPLFLMYGSRDLVNQHLRITKNIQIFIRQLFKKFPIKFLQRNGK